MEPLPGCTCPAMRHARHTAEEFDLMAACPFTTDDDRALYQRTAERLRERRARRADASAIVFDSIFLSDAAIRLEHRRALMLCECPICDTGEPRDDIDDAADDGINPDVLQ